MASPKKFEASDQKCYCGSGRTVLCGRLATTELSFKPIAYLIKERMMVAAPKKPQPDIPQPPDIQPEKPDIQPEPRPEEISPAPDFPEEKSPPMSV